MSSLHEDRQRAESFGAAAEAYDRHRPAYPAELIEWLAPEPGTAVDVGCGTGRVSELLRARGWKAFGVEPDPRMAGLAQRKGLTVDVSTFEEWVPRARGVDLVCAGQAWHWVDPHVGYPKAAQLLREGGRFAAFWNLYRYEPRVQGIITELYAKWAPSLLEDNVFLGTARGHDERDLESLRGSGVFGSEELRVFTHHREQTVEEWLTELPTHSVHNALDVEVRRRLLEGLHHALTSQAGGTLRVTYDTLVVTGLRE